MEVFDRGIRMKYAVVTGSSRGIGAAIATKLEDFGYVVFRNGRSESTMENYIHADLSTLEGTNKFIEQVTMKIPCLDCLVLNAAITYRKPFKEIEYTHWQAIMDTNVNMPFIILKCLFEYIVEGGSVLFIGAMLGTKPHATSMPYGVSKAAVNMLAQSFVKEFAPRSIRVNVVSPGFVDTKGQESKPEWLRKKIESKIAMNRFATEQEVADMCLSVINNTYINGAIISFDGGYDME